jgi:hypothetical protein
MSLDIGLKLPVDSGNPEITFVDVGVDYSATDNLAPMWRLAGCYEALYKSAGKTASEVLPMLRAALAKMQDSPADYKELIPSNRWGNYDMAVEFLALLIANFAKYPKGIIQVWA